MIASYSQKRPDLDDQVFTDMAEFREAGTWEQGAGGRDGVVDCCQWSAKLRGCLCKAEPSRAGCLQTGLLRKMSGNAGESQEEVFRDLRPEDI